MHEKSINFDKSFAENTRGRDESGTQVESKKNETIETRWESVRPGLWGQMISGKASSLIHAFNAKSGK